MDACVSSSPDILKYPRTTWYVRHKWMSGSLLMNAFSIVFLTCWHVEVQTRACIYDLRMLIARVPHMLVPITWVADIYLCSLTFAVIRQSGLPHHTNHKKLNHFEPKKIFLYSQAVLYFGYALRRLLMTTNTSQSLRPSAAPPWPLPDAFLVGRCQTASQTNGTWWGRHIKQIFRPNRVV